MGVKQIPNLRITHNFNLPIYFYKFTYNIYKDK